MTRDELITLALRLAGAENDPAARDYLGTRYPELADPSVAELHVYWQRRIAWRMAKALERAMGRWS